MNFKDVFVRFGYWATPRLGTEYPSVSISIPIPPDESNRRAYPISDDLAMKIERCILVMHKVTPQLYDIFMAKYVYRLPIYTEYDKDRVPVKFGILDTFNINRHQYFDLLKTAETSLKLMMCIDDAIYKNCFG
ncbi:antiterminator Q family protein [Gallibacterium salpingitidis]|uniref:antiterminator Q family protein n=1 Tax=Gallibacterium salpingitidis TaxID=505341 RepID=UPI002670BF74|nr:antiterminator Q family protein [Gallibacterium salpingitidis]WKT00514.1 antiterminator Q family protein [Gallibacterium salpingitidis]